MNILEGKSNDLAIVEAMKKKFKLERKKRGYTISSTNSVVIKVAIHILARKGMCKFHRDEVPVAVVALATQCVE